MARGRFNTFPFAFALAFAVTLAFAVGAVTAGAAANGAAAAATPAARSAQYPNVVGDDADTVGFHAAPVTLTVPDVPLATPFHRLLVVPPRSSEPVQVMGDADVVRTVTSAQNPEDQSDVMLRVSVAFPAGAVPGAGLGPGVGGGVGAGVGAGIGMLFRLAQ